MPVDKFGRMSDTKTKESGVSLTYINNNYVRSDGGTPISGSLEVSINIWASLRKNSYVVFSQIVPYIPQQTQQPKNFSLTKKYFISDIQNQRLI